jgi:predicted transcriptional regulator
MRQAELFPKRPDFGIVRLQPDDYRKRTDRLTTLRNLVLSATEDYPGADQWLDRKVLPGVGSAERVAFMCYEREEAVASAILKRGDHSKFCHVSVRGGFRDFHLGDVFFAVLALEARQLAKEIHFTLPEGLWEARGDFFSSFGFTSAVPVVRQYRATERELRCSAPFNIVWQAVLRKLPKLRGYFMVANRNMHVDMVISMKPRYAELVLEGKKRVEFRRRFSSRWQGKRLAIYSSEPVQALVGEATISRVVVDSPERVWEIFSAEAGVTHEAFAQYARGTGMVAALVLENVTPYVGPVFLGQLRHFVDQEIAVPQSHVLARQGSPWAQAVSVAALLQSAFPQQRSAVRQAR